MKNYCYRFRFFLLTLAFGLASVPVFNNLYERWTEIKVDIPQVESETPIIVVTENPPFYKTFTQADLIENRDLSLYDSHSAFSNCFNQGFDGSEFRKCQKELPKTRDFIFQHWKEKKRAYIVYEWTGVDCSGDVHIFIEPDNDGEWHIILRSAGDFRYQELTEWVGYSLKYKRATDDNYSLEKGTFYLSVRDEKGNEIDGY